MLLFGKLLGVYGKPVENDMKVDVRQSVISQKESLFNLEEDDEDED